MKKLFVVSAFVLLGIGNAFAQQGQRSEEERAQMRVEMIKRVADRSAKDFDLKGDAKETFLKIYTAYQTEMFETNQAGMRQRSSENDAKKELSDDEANAKIQEQFTRQEEQIATMQSQRFGRKTERLECLGQVSIFNEAEVEAEKDTDEPETEEITRTTRTRKKRKPGKLDEMLKGLPVRIEPHELSVRKN